MLFFGQAKVRWHSWHFKISFPCCSYVWGKFFWAQKWKKPLHEWPFSRVRVGSSRELPLVGNGFLYAQPRIGASLIRGHQTIYFWGCCLRRLLTKGSLWGLTRPRVSTLSPWKLEQMAQLSLGLYPTFWGYICWQYLKLQCLGLVQKVCSSSAC